MPNPGAASTTSGRLRLPTAELAFDDTGTGPLAVYAHGMLLSRAGDDALELISHAPLIAAGHRLVRYDARGHGESTGRPVPADYAFGNLATDLLALLDHLGADGPVDLIGASMGTGTVLHTAVRAPTRFRRMVLEIPPTAWQTRPAQADAYRAAADIIETRGMEALGESMAVPPIMADLPSFPPTPTVADELLPALMRGASTSDLPDPDDIAALDHPVLILSWDTDPGHPVSTARRLAELLPHAELHVSTSVADVRTWGDRAARFLAADVAPR